VKRARRLAIYIAVCAGNVSMRAVARECRMTPEGVRKAVIEIEAARDDAGLDRMLNLIEGAFYAHDV
jgi:hypothetical protein